MDGKVYRFYCCGPTVYGPAHIGNFRTFVLQDVFRRVLESTGVKVKHVRNLTDVDDKTIRQSQVEGKNLAEFTRQWTEKFRTDCETLGMLCPDVEPGAVEHIGHQIELIEKLIERGHAYRAEDGSVYYDVSSFSEYGKLSRLSERSITTGAASAPEAGGETGAREMADEYDRDSAADFALWKARRAEDGENYWESPWGQGRPGWHIECSAMSMKYLGDSFDMHGGGIDLVFPHHENEIAQSEGVTGKPFAKHWFHVAHLMVEGMKMSKSLGNLYTLEDVEKRGYTANELRYVLLSANYRQPLNFTWDSMGAAKHALRKLGRFVAVLRGIAGVAEGEEIEEVMEHGKFASVWQALLDDLNTPEALGRLFTGVREVDRMITDGHLTKERAREELSCLYGVLRCLGVHPEEEGKENFDIPEEVQKLAEERWAAKQAKNFAESDRLRDLLKEKGWEVKDSKQEYVLTPVGG